MRLARRAGISPGLVYSFYEGKSELFDAVFDHIVERAVVNPAYAGDIANGDVYVEDAHEALIDRQTWQRAAAIAAERADPQTQRAAARTAFPVWFRCRAPRAVVLSCAVASVILIGVLPMSAAPAAAAQVAAPRNTVTFIGDSVTAGFGYCGPALASAAARTRRWPTRGTSARTT